MKTRWERHVPSTLPTIWEHRPPVRGTSLKLFSVMLITSYSAFPPGDQKDSGANGLTCWKAWPVTDWTIRPSPSSSATIRRQVPLSSMVLIGSTTFSPNREQES